MHGTTRQVMHGTTCHAEAALSSDVSISHKFGATAGLEAAVAGVRTVLLDTHSVKTKFDDVYSQADIEYDSMSSLIKAILKYKDGDLNYQALGDWSEILHFFHHDAGLSSVEFLRNEIDNAMLGQ